MEATHFHFSVELDGCQTSFFPHVTVVDECLGVMWDQNSRSHLGESFVCACINIYEFDRNS